MPKIFRKTKKTILVENSFLKLHYQNNSIKRDFFLLEFRDFKQEFFIPSSCDSINTLDLNVSFKSFSYTVTRGKVILKFFYTSTLWDKNYYVVVYDDYVEYFYELKNKFKKTQQIDTLRFFEGIWKSKFSEHNDLIKHFNDYKKTPYRDYSEASRVSFEKIFNPEPNNYSKQLFDFFEYSQLSANSDLDYNGGNFVFNPGLLAFLFSKNQRQWFSFGLAVKQNQYYFTEYEYIGGRYFGLNLNYWGYQVKNKFRSPSIIITKSDNQEKCLKRYVSILEKRKLINLKKNKSFYKWWLGPIVCGWGHQSYLSDLFRIRSPRERMKDFGTYNSSTQSNYEKIVNILTKKKLPWQTLVIDAKWFINPGTKELDIGKWPNLRQFVDFLHVKKKKVLIWWGMWDTEGLPKEECIIYSEKLLGRSCNREGRFLKFGGGNDGFKVAPDPTIKSFQLKMKRALKTLLGSEAGCYNLDGLKIDHVAATPGLYGLRFPQGSKRIRGIELLKYYHDFIYENAKKIKKDALIIGQSPNPYLANCFDMIRLGDIYSPYNDISEQMIFRAKMVKIANPYWMIDMDNWPVPNLEALKKYARVQPDYGVPSLYYLTHIDTTGEKIDDDTFIEIKEIWSNYLKKIGA